MVTAKPRQYTSPDRDTPQYIDDDSLCAEQKFLFDTFGFLQIEGALSPQHVAAANAAIDRHRGEIDFDLPAGSLSRHEPALAGTSVRGVPNTDPKDGLLGWAVAATAAGAVIGSTTALLCT